MTVSKGQVVYAPLRMVEHGRLSGPLALRKGKGEPIGCLPVYSSEDEVRQYWPDSEIVVLKIIEG